MISVTNMYDHKKFETYANEMSDKATPGSSHRVHNCNCKLMDFLFSSIPTIFLKINCESTITGKGLK